MWARVESTKVTEIINRPKAITIGGVSYPHQIFSWEENKLNAKGLYTITMDYTNMKDIKYYSNTPITYTYDQDAGTVTGTYGTATTKDVPTLKTQKKNLVNEEAFSTLKDSD